MTDDVLWDTLMPLDDQPQQRPSQLSALAEPRAPNKQQLVQRQMVGLRSEEVNHDHCLLPQRRLQQIKSSLWRLQSSGIDQLTDEWGEGGITHYTLHIELYTSVTANRTISSVAAYDESMFLHTDISHNV